jgi:hypothetical protein
MRLIEDCLLSEVVEFVSSSRVLAGRLSRSFFEKDQQSRVKHSSSVGSPLPFFACAIERSLTAV